MLPRRWNLRPLTGSRTCRPRRKASRKLLVCRPCDSAHPPNSHILRTRRSRFFIACGGINRSRSQRLVDSSLILSFDTDLRNLVMKRFAFIASMFALPLLTLAGAFAAQQQVAPKAAASACGCTECRCPNCNGEFCTCETCKCGACGCAKTEAAPTVPAKAGCCSARKA